MEIQKQLSDYIKTMNSLPNTNVVLTSKILSSVIITDALEQIVQSPDLEPFTLLKTVLNNQIGFLNDIIRLQNELTKTEKPVMHRVSVDDLFESAWTTYSETTYDHSVELVEKRLCLNGFNSSYFSGKRCFDGGCGTGRLSIAMAKMGAKEVVAVDIGGKSLEYFKQVIQRYKLKNIIVLQQDVTQLKTFESDSFDFVSSYGVLHHTNNPIRGLKEHMRITKNGGIFWLYLYGAGGFYWEFYDALRSSLQDIEVAEIKKNLLQFGLREGFIYTYLDNVFAPRVYYYESEIKKLFSEEYSIDVCRLVGSSPIDDPEKCINSKYGKEILGPEGEVRLAIKKIAKKTSVSDSKCEQICSE